MKNISKQRNSIKGALFGVAVGDALGGPVEFMSPEAIAQNYGRVSSMIGGGWLNLAPGEITDDTQMTLCVAEGIVESPGAPIEGIGRRFIQWANSGPKDIGGACASSISNARRMGGRTYPVPEMWQTAAELTQREAGRPVEGNGALMRTIFPGLYYRDHYQAEGWAIRIGKMTHAGSRSDEACILYTRMVNLATASESRPQDAQGVREFLMEHCRAVPEYAAAVKASIVTPASGGYVVDSMRIAVGSVANTGSFEEAVVEAVNLGGDADTNGAITGGLAGAWYGYDAIPEAWIAALAPDVRDTLNRLADAAVAVREGAIMDNVNISITPTEYVIASCNGCFARNYRTDDNRIGAFGEYAQDIYDVRIGSLVAHLCPKCLAVLEQQARHAQRNRALPEVFAIVKGSDFAPQIVKGKMEIVDDDINRVIVKIDAFTEKIYTFKTDDVQDFIFDTQAEAEARLVELTACPGE